MSFEAPHIDYAGLSPVIALTAGLCVVLLAGLIFALNATGQHQVAQFLPLIAVGMPAHVLRFSDARTDSPYSRLAMSGGGLVLALAGWAAGLYGFGWLRHLRAAGTALARSQAEAWSSSGVTSNVLVPGFVLTPLNARLQRDPERVAALAARTMVGRNGVAEDFATAALFLASPASGYVTGQSIAVDGGFSVH